MAPCKEALGDTDIHGTTAMSLATVPPLVLAVVVSNEKDPHESDSGAHAARKLHSV